MMRLYVHCAASSQLNLTFSVSGLDAQSIYLIADHQAMVSTLPTDWLFFCCICKATVQVFSALRA
jgi:hypothetical protein